MQICGLGYTVWLYIRSLKEGDGMDEQELRERLTRIENNRKVIQKDITDTHDHLYEALQGVIQALDRIEHEVRRPR